MKNYPGYSVFTIRIGLWLLKKIVLKYWELGKCFDTKSIKLLYIQLWETMMNLIQKIMLL